MDTSIIIKNLYLKFNFKNGISLKKSLDLDILEILLYTKGDSKKLIDPAIQKN